MSDLVLEAVSKAKEILGVVHLPKKLPEDETTLTQRMKLLKLHLYDVDDLECAMSQDLIMKPEIEAYLHTTPPPAFVCDTAGMETDAVYAQ